MIHFVCELLAHKPRRTVWPGRPQPCRCGRYFTYAKPVDPDDDFTQTRDGQLIRYTLVTEPLRGPRTMQ